MKNYVLKLFFLRNSLKKTGRERERFKQVNNEKRDKRERKTNTHESKDRD
jgi:hypothetical protein